MHKLKEINGNEIIKFLNSFAEEDYNSDDSKWCDVSVGTPLVFKKQKIKEGEYVLYFNAYFNNWGTDQEIDGNEIHIDKNGKVRFCLNEPFDGDGSDEVLEEILTRWLKNHTFNEKPEVQFYELIHKALDELGYIRYNEPEYLQKVIDKLIEAKAYIK